MLAYAFRVLGEQGYANISAEKFENTTNLLSSILDKGVSQLIKRGVRNDYISTTEITSSPTGKINIAASIKNQYKTTHKVVCEHEEFISDILLNQIIKAAIKVAISSNDLDVDIKRSLRKNLLYFSSISDIRPNSIKWANIRYDRNNASYKMLINICYLLISGLLQTQETGELRVANIIDDQKMHRLYERFILEYYKRHYPMFHVSAPKILWDTHDEGISFLPTMKTDVTIQYEDLTLIIDAKYYGKIMQTGQYGKSTLKSENIYQIFAYVKNLDKDNTGKVSGALLYAKTDESIIPDEEGVLAGNKFIFTCLDLNKPFDEVIKQMDNLVIRWLGKSNLKAK